ncbi:Regulatory protein, LuxR:Response regulator receiver [Candidatus Terasakiella magnetica]|nr:Regulatory protein, LuxR:Response regulator receiver [Candidatus Terasakiella magnetica]
MRILLADDQRLLRDAARPFLSRLSAKAHLVEASTFNEAVSVAANTGGIDLALLGQSLPGMDGVGGIRVFQQQFPLAKVVVVSACLDIGMTLDAISAGTRGVISKAISGNGMLNALRLILAGEIYLPAELVMTAARLAGNQTTRAECTTSALIGDMDFSPSEVEVIPLLLDGLSNKVIAQRCGAGEAAIKARLRSIYKKLGATNRAQAIWALLACGKIRSA